MRTETDVSPRQAELAGYFRAAHALRHGSAPEEAADDLCTIAYHTDWPLLRARIHGVFK